MKKTDLIDGMGLIDDRYILEADEARIRRMICFKRVVRAAATLLLLSILLPNINANVAYAMYKTPLLGDWFRAVTIREYRYSSGTKEADVFVPELTIDEESITDDAVKNSTQQSVGEINADIQEKVAELVEEFESHLNETYADAYEYLNISYEVILDNERLYTLRLYVSQTMADGYEWGRYYTIDKATGERLFLSNLFVPDSDYIAIISEYIRQQMLLEMSADENKKYWLDEEPYLPSFEAISEVQQFYINESGEIVICFDEGEVAPMYMGSVSFTIPEELISDILIKK